MPLLRGTIVPVLSCPGLHTLAPSLRTWAPRAHSSRRCGAEGGSPHQFPSLHRMSAPGEPVWARLHNPAASAAPGGAGDAPSRLPLLAGLLSRSLPAGWAPRRRGCWKPQTLRLANTDGSGGRTLKGLPTSTTLSVGAPPGELPQRRLGGGTGKGTRRACASLSTYCVPSSVPGLLVFQPHNNAGRWA